DLIKGSNVLYFVSLGTTKRTNSREGCHGNFTNAQGDGKSRGLNTTGPLYCPLAVWGVRMGGNGLMTCWIGVTAFEAYRLLVISKFGGAALPYCNGLRE